MFEKDLKDMARRLARRVERNPELLELLSPDEQRLLSDLLSESAGPVGSRGSFVGVIRDTVGGFEGAIFESAGAPEPSRPRVVSRSVVEVVNVGPGEVPPVWTKRKKWRKWNASVTNVREGAPAAIAGPRQPARLSLFRD